MLQPRSSFTLPLVCALILTSLPAAREACAQSAANPFGIYFGSAQVNTSKRTALAGELGVRFARPRDIHLDRWHAGRGEAGAFEQAGFKLILTVRNRVKRDDPSNPSEPPRDLAVYQARLAEVLDRYKPEILVVENEENSALFFSGTPDQYAAELQAACRVAHSKGVRCTNGGLASMLLAAMIWDEYVERGQKAQGWDFIKRATSSEELDEIFGAHGSYRVARGIEKGKALLEIYKEAGADYVNFHWYSSDPKALEVAVTFLREQTGLPPISNEMGQREMNANAVAPLLAKILELKLPCAVWSSADAPTSKALHERNGELRPNGRAFQAFLRSQFGAAPR